ncbi:MAG: alpha/beta fold hydrolase, partial [Chloroflexota bacterium]
MNRQDIAFDAEGTTLRGWLYHPPTKIQQPPVVVMAHGFAAVKEQYLERFAERFADAGMAVLLYDHRNFGASDGTPRNDIDPWQQIRDYQQAISFVRQREDVDGDRVGIWGTSFSGGHVLVIGAIDPRVTCVVSQVPTISGYASYQRRISPDSIQRMNDMLIADR